MMLWQWLSGPLSVLCCGFCPDFSNTFLLVNGRKYSIVRLLKEDDMSFLYLVRLEDGMPLLSAAGNGDDDDGYESVNTYTLKRIRCPIGNIGNVSDAMREIDNYKRFQSPYVVSSVDSQVIQELDGAKTIYIVFPHYPLGSLQDSIDDRILDGTFVSESECIRIMCGIARGLLCLHDSSSAPRGVRTLTTGVDEGTSDNVNADFNLSDNLRDDRDKISASYTDEAGLSMDEHLLELDSISTTSVVPVSYSHKMLSPSNIIFSSNGLPIISELGSCSKADVEIKTAKQLNRLREWVDDNFNSYMAPEFLDLKTNSKLSTKVDVWSFGCICYALLFGMNPFEREEQLYGASIKYAISTGKFSFPSQSRYSDSILDIIRSCLQVDPSERPSVSIVLNNLQQLQS